MAVEVVLDLWTYFADAKCGFWDGHMQSHAAQSAKEIRNIKEGAVAQNGS